MLGTGTMQALGLTSTAVLAPVLMPFLHRGEG